MYKVYTGEKYACTFYQEPTGWVRTGTFEKGEGRVNPGKFDWGVAFKASRDVNDYEEALKALREWGG